MNPLLLLLSLAATKPDPALLAGLEDRQLHLALGGRSTAVTGVAADPFTFYFGGIGGGVWKSTNAGTTWRNVSIGTSRPDRSVRSRCPTLIRWWYTPVPAPRARA